MVADVPTSDHGFGLGEVERSTDRIVIAPVFATGPAGRVGVDTDG